MGTLRAKFFLDDGHVFFGYRRELQAKRLQNSLILIPGRFLLYDISGNLASHDVQQLLLTVNDARKLAGLGCKVIRHKVHLTGNNSEELNEGVVELIHREAG